MSRKRWWLVAAVAGVLLIAAAAVSSLLGSNGAADDAESAEEVRQTSADAVAPDEDPPPLPTAAAAEAPVDSEPPASGDEPTEADDDSGTELSEAFGEPEHPVSGVEPHIPSRFRLDEPGPPADVCRGVLPARRVQLPLRFASTKPEGVDHLSWSPDCRRMVFRVGSTLWVANGDGTSDLPFLTAQHGLSGPAWSPDGEWIAFSQGAFVDGERTSHIYVVKPDALGLAQITSGVVLDREPAWSPDGTRIVFARRARVADSDEADGLDQYLVTVELETGAEQVLTAGGEHESWPSWSPDSASIAHRSGDGLVLLRLEDLSRSVLLDGVVGGSGAWSADRSAIAAMTEWSEDRATIAVSSLQDPATTQEYAVALEGFAEAASSSTPTLRWSETGEHLLFHSIDPRGTHWVYRLPVLSQRLR